MRILCLAAILVGLSSLLTADDRPLELRPSPPEIVPVPAAASVEKADPGLVEMKLQIVEVRDGKRTVLSRPVIRTRVGQSAMVEVNSGDRSIAVEIEVIDTEGRKQAGDVNQRRKKYVRLAPRKSISDIEIARQLRTPVSVSFKDAELSEVINTLSKLAGANIVIDESGLEQEGLNPSTKVSLNVTGVSLKTCLGVLLEPRRLDYMTDDGLIKVTSRERAEGPLETYNYSVAELIGKKEGDQTVMDAANAESLLKVIKSTIEPGSWDEVGGSGSVRLFEKTLSLVIRQNSRIHEEITALLDSLRSQN